MPTIPEERRAVRELLDKVDCLGFSYFREALAAIADHRDWRDRWDVRADLTPAQLDRIEAFAVADMGRR